MAKRWGQKNNDRIADLKFEISNRRGQTIEKSIGPKNFGTAEDEDETLLRQKHRGGPAGRATWRRSGGSR